jgi:hypothetical protein
MSNIDPTKPIAGSPTTQSVRDNFATAKTEIEGVVATANAAVKRAGDTMTGLLVLSADPTAALGAVTKQYVDSKVGGVSTWNTRTGAVVLTTADLTGALGVVHDANWNVMLGGSAIPANAVGGGQAFANILVAPNYASNLYYDGTNWRYLTAGQGWEMQAPAASGNAFFWLYAPNGAAGAVATLQALMSLSTTGTLQAVGAIHAMNDSGFGLSSTASYKYHTWQSGWSDWWQVSDGTRGWASPSGNIMMLSPSGGLKVAGGNVANDSLGTLGTWMTINGNNAFSTTGTATLLINGGGRATYGFEFFINGGQYFMMDGSGNFIVATGAGYQVGGGVWSAYSDIRIKQDLAEYRAGLNEVCALRPVSYRYRPETGNDDKRHVGLIAQDCEALMPEMVTVAPGTVGDITLDDMRTLNTTALQFALVNAVRELAGRITSLEARA